MFIFIVSPPAVIERGPIDAEVHADLDKLRFAVPTVIADAIDRAAMRAGLSGTDGYLEEWKRIAENCGDDLKAEAATLAARLEEAYDKERLMSLIRNGGNEPDSPSQS